MSTNKYASTLVRLRSADNKATDHRMIVRHLTNVSIEEPMVLVSDAELNGEYLAFRNSAGSVFAGIKAGDDRLGLMAVEPAEDESEEDKCYLIVEPIRDIATSHVTKNAKPVTPDYLSAKGLR